MTTVTDDNVHNIAIDGTFDDAQAIVKEMFNDQQFKNDYNLGSINSINWVRVLAQIVYYFYAYFRVCEQSGCDQVQFSVPTGNFGDIFAGYLAGKMGLPTRSLILATNANNILSRFVINGDYSLADVHQSLSPSMDIQVASNFERYLYYLYNSDTAAVVSAMDTFKKTGKITFSKEQLTSIHQDFVAASVNDQQTLDQISSFFNDSGYILDPHTAVGVKAATEVGDEVPRICLATAHPAKFPEAIVRAINDQPPTVAAIEELRTVPQRCIRMQADLETIKNYIAEKSL